MNFHTRPGPRESPLRAMKPAEALSLSLSSSFSPRPSRFSLSDDYDSRTGDELEDSRKIHILQKQDLGFFFLPFCLLFFFSLSPFPSVMRAREYLGFVLGCLKTKPITLTFAAQLMLAGNYFRLAFRRSTITSLLPFCAINTFYHCRKIIYSPVISQLAITRSPNRYTPDTIARAFGNILLFDKNTRPADRSRAPYRRAPREFTQAD